MKVLLSIKPEFAEKIFEGTKRFEFRKSVYKNSYVKTVVVYVTQPVGMIIGEFDVTGIVEGDPSELWSETRDYSGISEEFFHAYFDGRRRAYALAIGDVRRYDEPMCPDALMENFTPPQSYMYVDDDLSRLEREPMLPF